MLHIQSRAEPNIYESAARVKSEVAESGVSSQ